MKAYLVQLTCIRHFTKLWLSEKLIAIFLSIIIFIFPQLTLHAKKAAGEASKQALEVSKQAAGVSKNTFEDLSYVSKSTLGDLTKTAKEAATKKGLIKTEDKSASGGNQLATQKQMQSSGGAANFFSNIGSDFNGLASTTTNMFSGMFGGGKSKNDRLH